MAISKHIRTYFEGVWHDGDAPIMRAADHGSWLGTTVFDGARAVNGLTPDLDAHCARVNRSAEALMITPTVSVEAMVEFVHEGLSGFSKDAAVYIRPMYWAIDGEASAIVPKPGITGFAICLEEVPLAAPDVAATLTTTRFCRPVLESSVVNAKAGCLYPNNARMLAEAKSKGYTNALVTDALGNVAETATANIFMVRDGEVFTPIPNGTFLSGITRSRTLTLLAEAGYKVGERTLSVRDFMEADEIFSTGNHSKVVPIVRIENRDLQPGPVAKKARELYWEWAHS